MNKTLLAISCTIAACAAPAMAQEQLGTIERGHYVCELPGDATAEAGEEQPGESFSIESASRYTAVQGSGTYLRRGDTLIMTSGPRNGDRYRIMGNGFLRKLSGDTPGRLRCVRQSR